MMSDKILKQFVCVILLLSWHTTSRSQEVSLDFIIDFVHNNPGEAAFETKYNDPFYLKSQGFNGAVTHWHVNCAVDYSNIDSGLIAHNSGEGHWISERANRVDSCLTLFDKAEISVYPFTDFLVLPKSVWEKYGDLIRGSKTYKPDINKPKTKELIIAQIDGIFSRFPSLAGLTTRFGETYLHDTPWHMGDSPIGEDAIHDHIELINLLREEICVKRNKVLIYRTWDFGYNFHNNPEFYRDVTDNVEPHPNLIFSIKYQQDDYHRMTPFNPTLGIGRHRQIVESQSRMEAYGKGAHPYYVASGVINGWPETEYEIEFGSHRFTGKKNASGNPRGIADVLDSGLLCGVMTWSHGGGWQGPYIKHEIWTDLNTLIVSNWAKNPCKTEEEIFTEVCGQLHINNRDKELVREIALLSIEGVRKGQLNSYVANDVWWSRDEFFSAKANLPVIKEAFSKNVMDSILSEKAVAMGIWDKIEALSREINCDDMNLKSAIRVSSTYGRIKYHLINHMWILMSEKYRNDNFGSFNREKVADSLAAYDRLWQEWRDLEKNEPLCASLYTDLAFRNRREGSIGELVDEVRKLL